MRRVLAVLGASAHASRLHSSATPLGKVTELLVKFQTDAEKEKAQEMAQYAAYNQFCGGTEATKKKDIKADEDTEMELSAHITKGEADTKQLGTDIEKATAEAAEVQIKLDEAIATRKTEREEYTKLHKDYSLSIDAVQRAVEALKAQNKNVAQAAKAALVDVSSVSSLLMTEEQRKTIDRYLSMDKDIEDPFAAMQQPGEAHGYESSMSSVIDMLEKLKDKFVDERGAAEKAEANLRDAHASFLKDNGVLVEEQKAIADRKTQLSGTTKAHVGKWKGELSEVQKSLETSKADLTELVQTCKTKATEFEERQKLRTDELSAIQKAIEILGSNTVKGNAEKYLPKDAAATSFLQIRSFKAVMPDDMKQMKIIDFLKSKSTNLNSRILSTLALKVAQDPFAKVRELINQLITRLKEEATQEQGHNAWCESELKANEAERTDAADQLLREEAELEGLSATISEKAEQITQLSQEITDTNMQMAEAQELRIKEKTQNEQTIKDSQESAAAVQNAIVIIKEFYENIGKAALVQTWSSSSRSKSAVLKQAPAIFEGAYTGVGGGSVTSILEVLESDFTRLETQTAADETTAEKDFDEAQSKAKIDLATKKTQMTNAEKDKADAENKLAQKKQDVESAKEKLANSNKYYEKLKPSCVDSGETAEERKKKREEEISALNEALEILNGQ